LLRPYDAGQHAAIGGERVAFDSHGAELRSDHLEDVMIRLGFALEVLAAVNRGAVLAVRRVFVEERIGGAFIREISPGSGGGEEQSGQNGCGNFSG
jgi:hypothetical protein